MTYNNVEARTITFESIKLKKELKKRTNKEEACGEIARQCLDKHFYLMREGLSKLDLTMEEACLIIDASNGSILYANGDLVRAFWCTVQGAIEYDQLDEKWKVDGNALVKKLENLPLIETFALVDACERFWNSDNEDADMKTRIYEVGLVKKKE